MKSCSLQSIAHHLNLVSKCKAKVSGFAIDSRQLKRGELFFALPGGVYDGHQFLEQCAVRGALGAVVSNRYRGPDFNLELLRVGDVKKALHILAKVAFSTRKEKVIAITGSMGKTTTKEFLASLLSSTFRVFATLGSYNSQLTFPLTLLNLEGEYDYLVLEMGMSQPGQIQRLVEIAPPDYAMVTRIAPAGMEGFKGGLQAIARAKAEVFSHKKTRLGFISAQAAHFEEILYAGGIPKCIYGEEGDFTMEEHLGKFVINDSPPLTLFLEGAHLRENFLGAASMARTLGVSWYDIQRKAMDLRPVEKRFEKIEQGGVTFIQDSYNANPESMIAALSNLPKPKGNGKVIGVLGKMPDLGECSETYHRHVGDCATQYVDTLLSIGHEAKWLNEVFSASGKLAVHCDTLASVKELLFSQIKKGDVVLIKGANSLKLWEILEK